MIISIIAAIAKNNVIGCNNSLIWHLPNDLKYFKNKTSGHHILMGRNTYQSIGKKLIDRKIIIVTRDESFQGDDCIIVNSIEAGLNYAKENGEMELFICGGEQVYQQLIGAAHHLYLTYVDCELQGDSFFPNFQQHEWRILNKITQEKDNKHQYSFETKEYERIIKY